MQERDNQQKMRKTTREYQGRVLVYIYFQVSLLHIKNPFNFRSLKRAARYVCPCLFFCQFPSHSNVQYSSYFEAILVGHLL